MTGEQEHPSLPAVLQTANVALRARGRGAARHGRGDATLLRIAFPDWNLIDTAFGFPPRALLHHPTHDCWLLLYAPRHSALLPGRAHAQSDKFEFRADPKFGNQYVLGSDATLIDHALAKSQTAEWSREPLRWLVERMPTDRARAELLLLALP